LQEEEQVEEDMEEGAVVEVLYTMLSMELRFKDIILLSEMVVSIQGLTQFKV